MKFGLTNKITIVVLLVVLLVVISMQIINNQIIIEEFTNNINNVGNVIGQIVKSQLVQILDLGIKMNGLVGFENQCKAVVLRYPDVSYAMVISPEGKILFHNNPENMGRSITQPLRISRITSRKNELYRVREGAFEYYEILVPHINETTNELIAIIAIGMPVELVDNKRTEILMLTTKVGMILWISSGILVFFAVYILLSRSLNHIILTMNEIREKKTLDKRVSAHSNDAIGKLVDSFNKMTEELEKTTVSRDYVDNIFKNMIDLLIVTNADGIIESCNDSTCRQLGYKLEELVGQSVNMVFSPNMNPFTISCNKSLWQLNSIVSMESCFRTKSGNDLDILLNISYVIDGMDKTANRILVAMNITDRKKRESDISLLNKQLIEASRRAGMAEITTNILHNLGNLLNSVSISSELIEGIVKSSNIESLLMANNLLENNRGQWDKFLIHDKSGKYLPEFYIKIGDALKSEQNNLDDEIKCLSEKINIMKEVIHTQQEYARGYQLNESISLFELVDDVLRLEVGSFFKHSIKIIKKYENRNFDITLHEKFIINTEKNKLLNVIINIMRNAKDALKDMPRDERIITLDLGCNEEGHPFLTVTDNGMGIEEKNLNSIFSHGFTSKADGHGFGLHFCAISMLEMGGKIEARSEGTGKGATFTLFFNVFPPKQ